MMTRSWRARPAIAAVALAAVSCTAPAFPTAYAQGLKPVAGPLEAEGSFGFDGRRRDVRDKRQSLSGIACPPDSRGPRGCIVVFDEGIEARAVQLGEHTYKAEPTPIVLLSAGEELDAEAATGDGNFVYVTGSHAVKRDSCDPNPDSGHVVRFRVDPVTYLPLSSPTTDRPSRRLTDIMRTLPPLAPHVGGCLGKGGVDIEGLAVRDGRLFFGFRGPTTGEAAYVLSVDADPLFDGGDPHPVLASVTVGRGRGIRDIAAVKDGLLILAGPDDDPANAELPWTISLWDGRTPAGQVGTPKHLGELDLSDLPRHHCSRRPKPEALAVLEDSPDRYRVVVLSDGVCDGGPIVFNLQR